MSIYIFMKKQEKYQYFSIEKKCLVWISDAYYSYMIVLDAKDEEPRKPVSPRGKAKHQPAAADGTKSSSRCLKMNNNSITNLECFIDFAKLKFEVWEDIAWIDLSQNELTKLGPVSNYEQFYVKRGSIKFKPFHP